MVRNIQPKHKYFFKRSKNNNLMTLLPLSIITQALNLYTFAIELIAWKQDYSINLLPSYLRTNK